MCHPKLDDVYSTRITHSPHAFSHNHKMSLTLRPEFRDLCAASTHVCYMVRYFFVCLMELNCGDMVRVRDTNRAYSRALPPRMSIEFLRSIPSIIPALNQQWRWWHGTTTGTSIESAPTRICHRHTYIYTTCIIWCVNNRNVVSIQLTKLVERICV